MKLRLLTLAALLSLAGSASAQFTTFTANHVVNASGVPLPLGSICARTVDANNKPLVAGAGSGSGIIVDGDACATVTAGAVSGFQVIDTSVSRPLNVCLRITEKDATGAIIRTIPCVQVTGTWCTAGGAGFSSCNFDSYIPNVAPLAIIQTGPQGIQGPPGGPNSTATRLSAVDMNTVKACGNYDGVSMVNGPPLFGSNFFHFQVICSNDPGFVTQVAYDMVGTTLNQFTRNEFAGTWLPWKGSSSYTVHSSGCTPTAGVLSMCTAVVNLPLIETDAGYRATCSLNAVNAFPGATHNLTTTTILVDIFSSTSGTASIAGISCIVTRE